jgi:hypothetical protein
MVIETDPEANDRRIEIAERTHEFLVNQQGIPEQDIHAHASYTGVNVQIHKDAADDPDTVVRGQ